MLLLRLATIATGIDCLGDTVAALRGLLVESEIDAVEALAAVVERLPEARMAVRVLHRSTVGIQKAPHYVVALLVTGKEHSGDAVSPGLLVETEEGLFDHLAAMVEFLSEPGVAPTVQLRGAVDVEVGALDPVPEVIEFLPVAGVALKT
jgi:hypothetical protein